MASDTTGGAASGAATGAAVGTAIMPGIGTIIGAVIGGAIGYFSGAEKKIAKKYARKAADQKRIQQTMKLAIQRRDTIRAHRAARAQAIAAGAADPGVTSTSVAGATSSTDMQGFSALNYFDAQVGSDNLFQEYSKKAGKHAQKAEQLDTILAASADLASIGADAYGMAKKPSQSGGSTSQYSSFNSNVSMQNNSAFKTFGSSLNLDSQ